jgi:hypothetical protein
VLNVDLRKIYRFTPVTPAPAAGELPQGATYYYECLDCQGIVSSVSHAKVQCVCGNLSGGSGEIVIKNAERLRVLTGKLR